MDQDGERRRIGEGGGLDAERRGNAQCFSFQGNSVGFAIFTIDEYIGNVALLQRIGRNHKKF
jgi:hypothetical protein